MLELTIRRAGGISKRDTRYAARVSEVREEGLRLFILSKIHANGRKANLSQPKTWRRICSHHFMLKGIILRPSSETNGVES